MQKKSWNPRGAALAFLRTGPSRLLPDHTPPNKLAPPGVIGPLVLVGHYWLISFVLADGGSVRTPLMAAERIHSRPSSGVQHSHLLRYGSLGGRFFLPFSDPFPPATQATQARSGLLPFTIVLAPPGTSGARAIAV